MKYIAARRLPTILYLGFAALLFLCSAGVPETYAQESTVAVDDFIAEKNEQEEKNSKTDPEQAATDTKKEPNSKNNKQNTIALRVGMAVEVEYIHDKIGISVNEAPNIAAVLFSFLSGCDKTGSFQTAMIRILPNYPENSFYFGAYSGKDITVSKNCSNPADNGIISRPISNIVIGYLWNDESTSFDIGLRPGVIMAGVNF